MCIRDRGGVGGVGGVGAGLDTVGTLFHTNFFPNFAQIKLLPATTVD